MMNSIKQIEFTSNQRQKRSYLTLEFEFRSKNKERIKTIEFTSQEGHRGCLISQLRKIHVFCGKMVQENEVQMDKKS